MQLFRDIVEDFNLQEISMEAGQFTWWNKRTGTALVRSELDRYLCNGELLQQPHTMHVLNIPAPSSDHNAIVLQPLKQPPSCKVPPHNIARLEPWWLGYPECTNIIQEQWAGVDGLTPTDFRTSLRRLKSKLRNSSQNNFGAIPKKIKDLRQSLLQFERHDVNGEKIRQTQLKLEQLIEAENDY